MPRTAEQIEDLRRRVAAIESWYHAIDLGDGVVTPGHFDMADYLHHYHLPDSLAGMRILDVGASTGYFAFEFERLGADEIVAIDLPTWAEHDWTPRYRREYQGKTEEERANIDKQVMRAGFDLCAEALGITNVRKVETAIYDLDPEALGTFDIVFCGSMLMHVRDPVLGIQRMRGMCQDDGRLIVSASTTLPDVDEPLARFAGEWNQCNWWQMNPRCVRDVLTCCDFETFERQELFTLSDVTGQFRDPTFVCHALPRKSR